MKQNNVCVQWISKTSLSQQSLVYFVYFLPRYPLPHNVLNPQPIPVSIAYYIISKSFIYYNLICNPDLHHKPVALTTLATTLHRNSTFLVVCSLFTPKGRPELSLGAPSLGSTTSGRWKSVKINISIGNPSRTGNQNESKWSNQPMNPTSTGVSQQIQHPPTVQHLLLGSAARCCSRASPPRRTAWSPAAQVELEGPGATVIAPAAQRHGWLFWSHRGGKWHEMTCILGPIKKICIYIDICICKYICLYIYIYV